jgi:hypothetical protein
LSQFNYTGQQRRLNAETNEKRQRQPGNTCKEERFGRLKIMEKIALQKHITKQLNDQLPATDLQIVQREEQSLNKFQIGNFSMEANEADPVHK